MKLILHHIFILSALFLLLNPVKSYSGTMGYFEKETLPSFVKVYPNPVKDKKVTIEISDRELSSIRILNITGKEVLYRKSEMPERIVELNLHHIPEGIYLLQINLTEKRSIVQKLMITSP